MNQFKAEILTAIVASGELWVTPAQLSEAVQCPPDVVQDCLADLETDRMITAWESDEGLFVTLTTLAASKLAVYVVNNRWFSANEQPNQVVVDDNDLVGDVDDLSLVGSFSAMSLEKARTRHKNEWQGVQRFDEYALPYPTVLLGSSTALWDNIRHAVCPSCGNRELKDYEFCLRCERWGLDHILEGRDTRMKMRAKAFHQQKVLVQDGLSIRR